jgi:hypothetical protein
MDRISAKMVLSEYYEVRTGICNHPALHKTRPISTVAFHDAEDITKNSLLEEAIRNYARYDIYSIFGLNLNDFLSLPMDICSLIENAAISKMKDKSKVMTDIESEMKNLD